MSEDNAPDVAAIAGRLSEVDCERLFDLIAGYEHCAQFRKDREGDRYGVAPIDCGGTDSSDHSYRFTKLVRLGLAEHRKRGCDWGQSPRRVRGSKVYRPTPRGLALRNHLMEKNDVQG